MSQSKLNVASASAVVAASMIGAGVYTTSGYTLGDLGSPFYVMMAWAIGGLIAICGAICYGALAKQFTESGGEYLFLARAVHPAAGMMAGWVSLLAGFTGAMAFAATTFESIAIEAIGGQGEWSIPAGTIATLLVVVAALVHSFGLQRGTQIQNGVVAAKLVLIVLFLIVSYSTVASWQNVGIQTELEPVVAAEKTNELTSLQFMLVFANALTWISLSYSGFNAAVYLTDEIEDPRRNVPRAMVWGTTGVTAIYLLLNAVFVYAPDPSVVAFQGNVATLAAESIGTQLSDRGVGFGTIVGPLVRIVILVGLATSVLALTQTGPRVYLKMASDGLLPRRLIARTVDGVDGAEPTHEPLPAIWIQACLAIIVISLTTLKDLLTYLGFTLSVCAALCGSLVFLFRNHDRFPVRVWGYPIVPAIYVLGTATIATLTAYRVPVQAMVGFATLSIGIVAYFLSRSLWGSRGRDDRRN